jgi:hypothetical protein
VVQYQLGKSCMAARGLVVDYLEFLFWVQYILGKSYMAARGLVEVARNVVSKSCWENVLKQFQLSFVMSYILYNEWVVSCQIKKRGFLTHFVYISVYFFSIFKTIC